MTAIQEINSETDLKSPLGGLFSEPSSIPLLDDILPRGWNLDMGSWQFEEFLEKEIRESFKNFKQTDSLKELIDELINNALDDLPKSYERIHDNLLSALGLDTIRTDSFIPELNKWYNVPHGKYKTHHPVTDYAGSLSFILRMFRDDPKDKTVVEIGPGDIGLYVLQLLAKRGANVIGIDHDEKLADEPAGKGIALIEDHWENISKCLEGKQADVIFTSFMHPDPELFGEFALKDYGGETRHKKYNSKIDFQKHVAAEMLKVLKPGGIFFAYQVSPDHRDIPPQFVAESWVFKDAGYKCYEISMGRLDLYDNIQMMQKPKTKIIMG